MRREAIDHDRTERAVSGVPRMTLTTQLVLRAMLEDPAAQMYGLQIRKASGLPSGTIHPILERLEGLGWLESQWEEVDPREQGRPRRRYYRLTEDGVERARIALAGARTPIGGMTLLPRTEGET